jgi:hypothetical protein
MKLNNYESFVNEKMGVAYSSIFISKLILVRTMYEVQQFTEIDENEREDIEKSLVINYSDIKQQTPAKNEFEKFPISQVVIDLTIKPYPENFTNINTGKDESWSTSAYASSFGRINSTGFSKYSRQIKQSIDHTISINMGIEIEISNQFDWRTEEKKLKVEVLSCILHELNHLYEHYQRKQGNAYPIELSAAYAAETNKYKIKKEFYSYFYEKLAKLVYLSENHEINAAVQEAVAYVIKCDTVEQYRRECPVFLNANVLINYNGENFLNGLKNEIRKIRPDQVEDTPQILKDMWVSDYKQLVEDIGEREHHNVDKLERMSVLQFCKYWEKRLNRAGERLKKKLLKLYTLKDELQDIVI